MNVYDNYMKTIPDIDEIVELYSSGVHVDDIAKKFNRSRTTIYNRINRYKFIRNEVLHDLQSSSDNIANLNIRYQVYHILKSRGIYSIRQISTFTDENLLDIRGIGVAYMNEIRYALNDR